MTIRSSSVHPSLPHSAREIWFEASGTPLFALEVGQGSPVVFMHGALADHRAALLRVGPLARTHRLICPDLRGSGRSIHAGSLTWDALADDIAALLHHLGLRHAVIGGTSMGSAVALRVALRHSELVRGVMLISPLYPGGDRPLPEAWCPASTLSIPPRSRTSMRGISDVR